MKEKSGCTACQAGYYGVGCKEDYVLSTIPDVKVVSAVLSANQEEIIVSYKSEKNENSGGITIYDLKGRHIRTCELGFVPSEGVVSGDKVLLGSKSNKSVHLLGINDCKTLIELDYDDDTSTYSQTAAFHLEGKKMFTMLCYYGPKEKTVGRQCRGSGTFHIWDLNDIEFGKGSIAKFSDLKAKNKVKTIEIDKYQKVCNHFKQKAISSSWETKRFLTPVRGYGGKFLIMESARGRPFALVGVWTEKYSWNKIDKDFLCEANRMLFRNPYEKGKTCLELGNFSSFENLKLTAATGSCQTGRSVTIIFEGQYHIGSGFPLAQLEGTSFYYDISIVGEHQNSSVDIALTGQSVQIYHLDKEWIGRDARNNAYNKNVGKTEVSDITAVREISSNEFKKTYMMPDGDKTIARAFFHPNRYLLIIVTEKGLLYIYDKRNPNQGWN